jgi:hypothetical protein
MALSSVTSEAEVYVARLSGNICGLQVREKQSSEHLEQLNVCCLSRSLPVGIAWEVFAE